MWAWSNLVSSLAGEVDEDGLEVEGEEGGVREGAVGPQDLLHHGAQLEHLKQSMVGPEGERIKAASLLSTWSLSAHLIFESLCRTMLSFSRTLRSTVWLSRSRAALAPNHPSLLHAARKLGSRASRGRQVHGESRGEVLVLVFFARYSLERRLQYTDLSHHPSSIVMESSLPQATYQSPPPAVGKCLLRVRRAPCWRPS